MDLTSIILQSQSAFETARKDLSDVVSNQLTKLTGEVPKESSPEENTTSEAENDTHNESSSEAATPLAESTSSHQELSSSSLLSRIQSALPPNIVSTVQNNIPETLKHATENIDLAQLRVTLSNEFQRVQDATMAHAGEYVHKSEELLRGAMKEAGEVLRDAVKVIPPEEAETSGVAPAFVWDGSDIWMLPVPAGEYFGGAGKGKERESSTSSGWPSTETQRAVATRAESLLKQLKHNPEIIKHDPESDDVVRELYTSWVSTEVDTKQGGIEGEEWSAKVTLLLNEPGDGQALQASHDALGTLYPGLALVRKFLTLRLLTVPSEMTNETFWKRYFFRVYQIGREEEKRKALLRGTILSLKSLFDTGTKKLYPPGSIENEEDFSWEDEEEESTQRTTASGERSLRSLPVDEIQVSTQPDQPLSAVSKPLADSGKDSVPSQALTPTLISPRESSEESYDLLSSENDSASGDKKNVEKRGDREDPDSDWE
jgi:hypothetical protein